jgi:hypothetical protein
VDPSVYALVFMRERWVCSVCGRERWCEREAVAWADEDDCVAGAGDRDPCEPS